MIKAGDKIINSRTGQVMLFLKTGAETKGELLQIDCVSPHSAFREPEHVHPYQENKFEMLSGSCTFRVAGKERLAKAGDTVIIPPAVPHLFWNSFHVDAHYIQEFRPALSIAEFFDTFFALSRDGKLNAQGVPNFFHASLIMLAHNKDIRVTSPPWPVQYFTYKMLAPIGTLMGYKPFYHSLEK